MLSISQGDQIREGKGGLKKFFCSLWGENRSVLPSLYLWEDYVPLEGGLEWESRLLVEAG